MTLSGFVRSYRQRRRAEQDAKHVAGVVGLANNINVHLPIIHSRPDPAIARDAVDAIRTRSDQTGLTVTTVVAAAP